MTLQSKSFLVYKGDTLESIAQFLQQEIGLNAYLIKTIKGVSLSENVTQITLLFEKYASNIIDSVAPREGAIFTTGVASDDFDLRFLFNDPVDFRSIQSGTFSIDGVGLDTGRVYLDQGSNDYFLKVSASGSSFQSDAFHTYQLSTSLKRQDGSTFSYTPVGGYVFHTLSNAHIGDYTDPYIERRRGRLAVAVVRLSKGINPQLGISEFLSQKQLSDDRLIAYTPITTSTNTVDVYFIYIDQLEPQIIGAFPLDNSLLPEISAPGKVTFVFNTALDKAKLSATTGLFSIEEGFSTSTSVPPSKVTLLDDLQTIEIDTSTYFTSQKIYSILARPGILGLDGLEKEKPEQWTIHIASYESVGSTGSSTGVSQTDFNVLEASFTGHTGDPTIHYTQSEIDIGTGQINDLPPLVTVPEYTALSGMATGHTGDTTIHFTEASISHVNIADIGANTHVQIDAHIANVSSNPHSVSAANVGAPTTASFTGHTGETGIHYEVTSISHSVIQEIGTNTHAQIDAHIADVTTNPHSVTAALVGAPTSAIFTGHTGETGIHYEVTSISHAVIQDIGSNSHATIDTHIGSTSNPHSVSAAQVGAPTTAQFTGHTGETGVHFNMNSVEISVDQVNSQSATDTHVMTADGAGGASWEAVAGGGGDVTTAQYNYLSGEHSGLFTSFTGHTGDSTIHYTQAAISITESQISDLGIYATEADLDILSGSHTGHTGDTTVHFTEASIDHTNIQSIGTKTHSEIDDSIASGVTHRADSTTHFTESSIDHDNISNNGSWTHAQIDTHITSGEAHVDDATIHFTEGSISHTNITDIGSNTHAAIDTHIATSATHYTEASIDHDNITNNGAWTHSEIDADIASGIAHAADTSIHFAKSSIDHSDLLGGGSNSHASIDAHISAMTGHTGDSTIHFDTLAELSDTSIITLTDGQLLVADKGGWTNTGIVINEIGDIPGVTISAPAEAEVLAYIGGVWVNSTAGAASTTLTGLSDTDISTEYYGAILGYNTTSGQWTDMRITGSNGITITEVPEINALFIGGNDPLASANNLSDLTDVEDMRRNTKTRYHVEDMMTTHFMASTNHHGVGNSYMFAINSENFMTGSVGTLGVITASCGNETTAGASAALRYQQSASLDLYVRDAYYFRAAISHTVSYHSRFGLTRASFNAEDDVANGAYFEFNSTGSANWFACTAASSSRTKVDLGISAVADEWKWWGIQSTSSGVFFYDMDSTEGDVLAFIATNVPTKADSEMRCFVNNICNGATYRHMWLDKFAYPMYAEYLPSGLASQI